MHIQCTHSHCIIILDICTCMYTNFVPRLSLPLAVCIERTAWGDEDNFNNLRLPRTVYWCVIWVQGGACWPPHTRPPHHTPTPQCRQEAGHPSASQCPAWTSGNQTVMLSVQLLQLRKMSLGNQQLVGFNWEAILVTTQCSNVVVYMHVHTISCTHKIAFLLPNLR